MFMKNIMEMLKLYVIPDRKIGAPFSLEEQTEAALRGGATLIQLRDKEMEGRCLFEVAQSLRKICHCYGTPLIINDRVDVALAVGADGVHLGQDDLPLEAVKPFVPDSFIVGVSAHTVEEAEQALALGASYIGIGAAYPTGSKVDAKVVGPSRIREIMRKVPIPAVAIGGITIDKIPEIMTTGVQGVALISAVIGAPNIQAEAQKIMSLIEKK
jgi:thiamine-phosphate pyrophosphorylase